MTPMNPPLSFLSAQLYALHVERECLLACLRINKSCRKYGVNHESLNNGQLLSKLKKLKKLYWATIYATEKALNIHDKCAARRLDALLS